MKLRSKTRGAGREHTCLHLNGKLCGAWGTGIGASRYTTLHVFLIDTMTNLDIVLGQICSYFKHRSQ